MKLPSFISPQKPGLHTKAGQKRPFPSGLTNTAVRCWGLAVLLLTGPPTCSWGAPQPGSASPASDICVHMHSKQGLVFTDPGQQLSSPMAVPAGLGSTSSPRSAECLLPCPPAHSSLCTVVGLNTDTWGLFFSSSPQAAKAGSPEDHYALLCVRQEPPSWFSSSGFLGMIAIQIPDLFQLKPAVLQPPKIQEQETDLTLSITQ